MPYDRLEHIVSERFEILDALGYNTSLHFAIDETSQLDQEFRRRWARQFEHEPSLATGVIAARTGAIAGSRRPRRTVRRLYASDRDALTFARRVDDVPPPRGDVGRVG